MGTCRHIHLQTKSYGLICFQTQSYMHGCKSWHSDTGYILLTSYRSKPFPTPGSYTKRFKPTILYKSYPGTHTYIHSTDLLTHIDTWLRLTATYTEAGRHVEQCRFMYTHTHIATAAYKHKQTHWFIPTHAFTWHRTHILVHDHKP